MFKGVSVCVPILSIASGGEAFSNTAAYLHQSGPPLFFVRGYTMQNNTSGSFVMAVSPVYRPSVNVGETRVSFARPKDDSNRTTAIPAGCGRSGSVSDYQGSQRVNAYF